MSCVERVLIVGDGLSRDVVGDLAPALRLDRGCSVIFRSGALAGNTMFAVRLQPLSTNALCVACGVAIALACRNDRTVCV